MNNIIGMEEGKQQILDHAIAREEQAISRYEKALEAFERARQEGRKITKEETKEMAASIFAAFETLDETNDWLVKMGLSEPAE